MVTAVLKSGAESDSPVFNGEQPGARTWFDSAGALSCQPDAEKKLSQARDSSLKRKKKKNQEGPSTRASLPFLRLLCHVNLLVTMILQSPPVQAPKKPQAGVLYKKYSVDRGVSRG